MHSIQTKTTLLTVCAIVVTMLCAMLLASTAINNLGSSSSNQILFLLCETGERNLDFFFEGVEQSVETVSSYAEDDLAELGLDRLDEHLERVREIFEKTAAHTTGVLTYYYRIDPEVSSDVKGFWYVNLDGTGFVPHEVTDITRYDTRDQSTLVWFSVPKATGRPIWLPPYFTDNLDIYVLSYNVPIYREGRFIGVVGIEIDYRTIIEPVDSIALYDNGYAFINDGAGNLIYHPRIAMEALTGAQKPAVPDGMIGDSTYFSYRYEGVDKQGVWLPLRNGMRLNVAVPISEINGNWYRLINEFFIVSALLLLVFVALTLRFAGRITRPLRRLAAAAEQVDRGNYDVELDQSGNDEVGVLTRSFSRLIRHLKIYISDLNSLAYSDALTSVHNKGAFDIYVQKLQERLQYAETQPAFAVGVFDCDNLKLVNDRYGHDKGDIYLKTASALICAVFQHSPVFRTGGDEFTAVLQNDDYNNREELLRRFAAQSAEICAAATEPWEETHVSIGIAEYDPQLDRTVADVALRADRLMYEDKRARKAGRD